MKRDLEFLEDQYDSTLKWLFDACFGRLPTTDAEIGQKISLLGTLKRLLGRDR